MLSRCANDIEFSSPDYAKHPAGAHQLCMAATRSEEKQTKVKGGLRDRGPCSVQGRSFCTGEIVFQLVSERFSCRDTVPTGGPS